LATGEKRVIWGGDKKEAKKRGLAAARNRGDAGALRTGTQRKVRRENLSRIEEYFLLPSGSWGKRKGEPEARASASERTRAKHYRARPRRGGKRIESVGAFQKKENRVKPGDTVYKGEKKRITGEKSKQKKMGELGGT